MPTIRPLPASFVPLDNERNYDEWEQDLLDHFTLYQVDSYIDGCNVTWPATPISVTVTSVGTTPTTSTPATTASTAAASATATTTTTTAAQAPAVSVTTAGSIYGAATCVEEWSSTRRALCGLIRTAVTIEVRRTIPREASDDPKAMLDSLAAQFRKDAPMTLVLCLKGLLTEKKPQGRTWDAHINRIMDRARRAWRKDITLSMLTSLAIVMSATPDWDACMATCMQQCPLGEPQAFRAMLRAEEDRRADEQRTQQEVQALAAQFSKQQQQQPKQKRQDVKDPCTHPTCIDRNVQKTHTTGNCIRFKKERDAAAKKNEKKKLALAAKISDVESGSEAASLLAAISEHSLQIPAVAAHVAGSIPSSLSATSNAARLPAPVHAHACAVPLPMNPLDYDSRTIALAVAPATGAVDSGSQRHFEPDIARFHEYELLETPLAITCFTGAKIFAIGKGKVRYRMGKGRYLKLRDVYHTPGAAASLISVGALADNANVEVVFRKDCCVVRYSGKEIARGTRKNRGLYIISNVPEPTCTAFWASSRALPDLMTWHRRLGHPSMASVLSLARSGALKGVRVSDADPLPICEECLMTKSKVQPYPRSTTRTTECLEVVGSDLCGPMRTASLSGSRYALNHYDVHSHYLSYDFLRSKDLATNTARTRLQDLSAECGKPVRAVRTDNGGEFEKAYDSMLRELKIVHETTAPESSAQNGGAERAHQTIARRANAMLKAAGLSDGFWAEAWQCATYLHNRTPSRSLAWKTPYEVFLGKEPSYNRLAEFGCDAWVVLPEKERAPKQALKAVKCKFMGYYDHSKAYKCWNADTHKMIKTRNVAFVEPKDYAMLSSLLDAYIPPDNFIDSPTLHTPTSSSAPPHSPSTDRARASAGIDGVPDSQARARAESHDDASDEDVDAPRDVRVPNAASIPRGSIRSEIPRVSRDIPTSKDGDDEGVIPKSEPEDDEKGTHAASGGDSGGGTSADPPQGGEKAPVNPVPSARRQAGGGTSTDPSRQRRGGGKAPVNPEPARRTGRVRISGSMPREEADRIRQELTDERNRVFREGLIGLHSGNVAHEDEPQVLHALMSALLAGEEFPDRIPRSFNDAMRSPFAEQWRIATNAEMQSLSDHKVFEHVAAADVPGDKNIVDCRWVFNIKHDENGKPVKLKARLCAKGFSQRPGEDYGKTSAPTCRPESVRALLSLAALHDWEVHHYDVKTAFLNGDLDEEIYMKCPPGYGIGIVRLLKALYGLKQASRCWYKKLRAALASIGFKPLMSDRCVFFRKHEGGVDFIAIHVDDLLAFARDTTRSKLIGQQLESLFTITDLGDVRWFLGLKIARDRAKRTLTISQEAYVDTLVKKFGLEDCKSVPTPCVSGKYLTAGSSETTSSSAEIMSTVPHRELVGGLTWLSVMTRPDIAFAVQQVAQFNKEPTTSHWVAAKRILRYLSGSKDVGLSYDHSKESETRLEGLVSPQTQQYHLNHGPHCFTDADWAACPVSRKSVSGYAFLLNGDLISWSSRKQKSVALSSVEAEFQAATDGGKEALWLSGLLRELEVAVDTCPMLMDSQGAMALADSPNFSRDTKHMATRACWLRDLVEDGDVAMSYVPTDDMFADVFTKPLTLPKFRRFVDLLGLRSTRGGVLDT